MRQLFLLGVFGVLLALSQTSTAQSFPSKPIKIIVPFAPGGPIDQTARIISQKMSDMWGQSVIVENKTGANGIISAEHVFNSPADGYMLLFSVILHSVMPSLKANLSYDIEKDFIFSSSVFSIAEFFSIVLLFLSSNLTENS